MHGWSHTELSIFPLYLLGIIAIHRFAPLGKPGYNTWVACEQWWTFHSVSHRLQTMTTAQSRWEKSSQTNFFTKAIYLIKAVFMSAQQEINVSSSDTRVKVFQCILTHPRLLSLSLCACYTHTHTGCRQQVSWCADYKNVSFYSIFPKKFPGNLCVPLQWSGCNVLTFTQHFHSTWPFKVLQAKPHVLYTTLYLPHMFCSESVNLTCL